MKPLAPIALAITLFLPGLALADAADEAIYYADENVLAKGLGLTNVSLHKKSFGKEVLRGILPDGKVLEFHLASDGSLYEIDSLSTFGFKANSVGRLLPPAVLANLALPQGAMLRKIHFSPRGTIVFDGWDARADGFLAEYSPQGDLLSLTQAQ